MSRKSSDGWEEKLLDETHKKSKKSNKLKQFYSDKDSLSNYSDRNSVLTGKSDIPLVQVHPPSDNNRTRVTKGYQTTNLSYNKTKWNNRFSDTRNQRNLGSDRRNKRYSNDSDKFNSRFTESDRGYNSDKLSLSSYQGSYLSPVVKRPNDRPRPNYDKVNGFIPNVHSPRRMDDVVVATQKQRPWSRGRTKPRYHRLDHGKRQAPPGTTPDKTVFPEKITLKIGGFPSPKAKNYRGNGAVVVNFDAKNPKWKRNSHIPLNGLHEYDNEVFEDDDDNDDVCSSSSSWIGIPWHSYKLPPGFQDPNADEELSV